MATNANAIASVGSANVEASQPTGNERDQYGRTASERTVELLSADAEAVNLEVAAGKHQTYDDALAYIISRGLAEIKRQRESLAKAADARRLQQAGKTWAAFFKLNPAMITDPKVMAKYVEEMTPTV